MSKFFCKKPGGYQVKDASGLFKCTSWKAPEKRARGI